MLWLDWQHRDDHVIANGETCRRCNCVRHVVIASLLVMLLWLNRKLLHVAARSALMPRRSYGCMPYCAICCPTA
jgi:hypothetical protein